MERSVGGGERLTAEWRRGGKQTGQLFAGVRSGEGKKSDHLPATVKKEK